MITQHNYFSSIEKIGLDKLPLPMQKTHDFIVRDTQNGSNWERSLASEAIKRTVDLQFNALATLLSKQEKETPVMKVEKKAKAPKPPKKTTGKAAPTVNLIIYEKESGEKTFRALSINQAKGHFMVVDKLVYATLIKPDRFEDAKAYAKAFAEEYPRNTYQIRDAKGKVWHEEKGQPAPTADEQQKTVPKAPCKCKGDKPKKAAAAPKKKPVQEYQEPAGLKVGHYPDEIRILRKVAGWEGKQVERKPFLALVRSMEKAIAERKIRKSSKNGKIITALQKNFEKGVALLNSEGATGVKINFNGQLGADIREAATSQVLFNSVPLLKRSINMMGDKPDKAKVERLNKAILSALATKKVGKKDIYRTELRAVQKSLELYLKGETSNLKLHHVPLSGLADVVGNVGK